MTSRPIAVPPPVAAQKLEAGAAEYSTRALGYEGAILSFFLIKRKLYMDRK
jgi:hypothetical protein